MPRVRQILFHSGPAIQGEGRPSCAASTTRHQSALRSRLGCCSEDQRPENHKTDRCRNTATYLSWRFPRSLQWVLCWMHRQRLSTLKTEASSLFAATRISHEITKAALANSHSVERLKELGHGSRLSFIHPCDPGYSQNGPYEFARARLVTGELGKCAGVETHLIDIAELPLPTNDAGEAIKQPDSPPG